MMKTPYLFILSLFFAGLSLSAKNPFLFRKNKNELPVAKSPRSMVGDHEARFAIKLNLTPLIFSSLSMQAEYAFHEKMSVALGASFLAKRTFPQDLYNAIDNNPYTSNFSTPVYEGKTITPEFRFYPFGRAGHAAPSGFYLAAYYRYAHYNAYQTVSYQDFSSPGQPVYTAKATHTYAGGTGGLMIGKQWIIGRHFSIDWWIIGGGYGKAKYTYSWQVDGVSLSAEQQAFVKEQADENFKNFTIFGTTPNVQTTSNSAFMSAMVPMFSLRFMGLCVGFAF